MAVTTGTRLGSLEIVELLGKGGMGEVYRARDLRLKREVAIKILPDEFLRDEERVSRFQREAEVLASLNHPNIGGIHSVEEADGARFLVLELIEGETLAERIQRGALPIDEALRLARSICEALESAHEKGIIHRDLKPANVKVTPDGTVKVLDFGLAKAMDNAPAAGNLSHSPTMTLAGTVAGMILGTAAYMSPEQAKGLNTDQRSDIFSFGAVFFEMVTGRQAFQGDSVSEVLASILAREPDFALLPPALHPKIVGLLRRALEKNPKRRWHAIGDLRMELESVLADPHGTLLETPRVAVAAPLWKRVVPVVAAVVGTAVLTSAAMWYFRPATPRPVVRFPISLEANQQFSNTGRLSVAISPDGTQIAYVAAQRLYRRAMSELEAKVVPGMETIILTSPVFSPNGRYLAFYSIGDNALKKIAVTGGTPLLLCPAENVYGMSWSDDGIVFGLGTKGVMRVTENGGTPELLAGVKPGELAHGPQILPGGKTLLYTVATGATAELWDQAQVFVQAIKPGSERQMIIPAGTDARYVPTGHIVYAQRGVIFAVPFDLGRLQVTGGPVPVVEGVRRSIRGVTGSVQFSFSPSGSLVYIPGDISIATGEERALAALGRQGGVERLKAPPKAYAFPRVSPDGKWVAVSTDGGNEVNVWIVDLAGPAAPRQLTLGGANRYPVWSNDGQRVAFQSDREGDLGIFWQKADGTGAVERLTKPEPGVAHIPDSSSPDGKLLSFTAVKGGEGALWILSILDKKASVFAKVDSKLIGRAAFSPDGRWLAYQSNEAGGRGNRIFVQPFPATGAKYSVTGGGHPFWSPVWSADGGELVFNPGVSRIESVSIRTRPSFSFGAPTPLPGGLAGVFSKNPSLDPRVWDFTPDGKRLIGVTDVVPAGPASGSPATPYLQVVLNWFEDLKQRTTVR